MKNLLFSLAMAAMVLGSNPATAQEIQYGTVTLDPTMEEWNLDWLDEGYTMVGVNVIITGPPFAAPSGSPFFYIIYRLNSMEAEIQYLNMFLAEESAPGVYRCEADFWGMDHQNAPIIYMGARIEWVDIEAQVTYAIYESHPDSMQEIHMPYATVTDVKDVENEVFTINPNPATDLVSLKGFGDAKSVEVIDLQGRVVFTAAVRSSIDISSLDSGHYILRTDSGHVHRFVKN